MSTFTPRRDATLKYEDERIKVYSDGTWRGLMHGSWVIPHKAVVYSPGTGDAKITTAWGHQKSSLAIAPDGTHYDIRVLALTIPTRTHR